MTKAITRGREGSLREAPPFRIREQSQRDGAGAPVPFDWMPEDQRPTGEREGGDHV